ncbi:MAG: extracellular solute-binding protein family 5 [Paenibacillaceae bacterium]|jgi:peptide/nickel transport system substrate-binding protein|nr:extracellular solute-binding protein family 5 [Paenibacillaceae bacterium]
MKKSLILTIAVLFLAAFITACGSSSSPDADASGASASPENTGPKTITFANTTDIATLDPRNATGTSTAGILSHVFSSLVTTDEKGQIKPDLAASYSNVDDVTWSFTLRDGVKFQDGSPLTSEDVKYTLETIRDKSKGYKLASDFSFMRVEIVDALNFKIITDEPFSALPLRLNYVKIIPKAYVEKVGDKEFAAKPIGSGPYKFVEWKKDERVVLEANDTYFGGKPAIDKVVYRVIPEAASRIAALESGEVDIIANVPTSQVANLKSMKNIQVVGGPTTRVVFIGLNTLKDGPLKDAKVRQALNYAVNKQTLIQGVLDGYATEIATISTPEYDGFDDSVKSFDFNTQTAKQLLAEAGYPNGLSLKFSVTSGYLNGQDVAQAIAAQLAEIGVKVTVEEEDSNQQREKIGAGTVADLYLNGIGGPYSNIDLVAKLSFGTGERYSTYSNPSFDQLRKKAAATVEPGEADKLLSQMQQVMKTEAPAIFLYQQHSVYAYHSRVADWAPRTDEMIMVSGSKIK